MNRIELRLDEELYQQLCQAKPRSLSLPAFCAFLIEEKVGRLDRGPRVPAYCVGAGTTDQSETPMQDLPTEQIKQLDGVSSDLDLGFPLEPKKNPRIYKAINEQLNAVTEVPAARNGRVRKPKAEGSPEFESFWRQYQAIKRRASNQSKPRALEVWDKVVANTTPSALCDALTRAVAQQARQEREGGFASPFPDCFRWLRDGYYEAFLDNSTPAVVIPSCRTSRHRLAKTLTAPSDDCSQTRCGITRHQIPQTALWLLRVP